MSFKNHGPGGCCCGNCCIDWSGWRKIQVPANVRHYPEFFNDYGRGHPLFDESETALNYGDHGWSIIPRDGITPPYPWWEVPWDKVVSKQGGSAHPFGINLLGRKDWNIMDGGTVSFDVSFDATPATFGVFFGRKGTDGTAIHVEVADGSIFCTEVTGMDYTVRNDIHINNPAPSKFAIGGLAANGIIASMLPSFLPPIYPGDPSLDDQYQSCIDAGIDPSGMVGAAVFPFGVRRQLPEYDGSGKVSVRLEFGGRWGSHYGVNVFINDYHVYATFVPITSNANDKVVCVSAGWSTTTSTLAQENLDAFWTRDPATTYSNILVESNLTSQGFADPNPATIYTIDSTEVCYNAYSSEVVQEVHPGSACESFNGPVCKSPCPGDVEMTKWGKDLHLSPDWVKEGSFHPYKKTPFGYTNPSATPAVRGFSTSMCGSGGASIYFDTVANYPASKRGDWAVLRTDSTITRQYNFEGGTFDLWLYQVFARYNDSKLKLQLEFYIKNANELNPPGVMSTGDLTVYLQRSTAKLESEVHYTFGPSDQTYSMTGWGRGDYGFGQSDATHDVAAAAWEAATNDGTGWDFTIFTN